MSLRRSATILLAVVLLAVTALGAWVAVGFDLDAERWRGLVAGTASRALGRAVPLDGAARLRVALRPEIVLAEVRLANPAGFGAPDCARAGEVRLALALRPLLHRVLRVEQLTVRDLHVRLERGAGGRGNWAFDRPASGDAGADWRFELRRLAIDGGRVEFVAGGLPLHAGDRGGRHVRGLPLLRAAV